MKELWKPLTKTKHNNNLFETNYIRDSIYFSLIFIITAALIIMWISKRIIIPLKDVD